MDEAIQKIAELTRNLDQSMRQLKRVYNEYQEEEEGKNEDPDALLNEL